MPSALLLGWSELLVRTVFSVCDSDFMAGTMVSLTIVNILSPVNQVHFYIFFSFFMPWVKRHIVDHLPFLLSQSSWQWSYQQSLLWN